MVITGLQNSSGNAFLKTWDDKVRNLEAQIGDALQDLSQ